MVALLRLTDCSNRRAVAKTEEDLQSLEATMTDSAGQTPLPENMDEHWDGTNGNPGGHGGSGVDHKTVPDRGNAAVADAPGGAYRGLEDGSGRGSLVTGRSSAELMAGHDEVANTDSGGSVNGGGVAAAATEQEQLQQLQDEQMAPEPLAT